MPPLTDMSTWTEHLGKTKLRTYTAPDGRFWLEQNPEKRSKWAKLAREGYQIAWRV